MPDAVRVGLVGAGQRASAYFRNIPSDMADAVRLTSVADPEPARREAFASLVGTEAELLDDGVAMLREHALDAAVVATPNDQHVPYALEAMRRGLPLLLEKPVATTLEDLAALWQAEQARPAGRTVVGFVLRYTPFYERVREIVRSGRLGEILAVQADENLGTGLTMVQYQGWRQDVTRSGGWMLEKCCHDLDVLGYLLDSRPVRVHSMASALAFRPRPEAEQLPRFRPSAGTGEIDYADASAREVLREKVQHSPYAPSGLPDRQVATLEFASGVLGTFTAVMAQPRTTRRLRIFGTEGLLEGDIGERRLDLSFSDPAGSAEVTREHERIEIGDSGHQGGDEVLGELFWHLAAGEDRIPRAGLADGIDAVLCAMALQESARTGRGIDLDPLREQVFGSAGTVAVDTPAGASDADVVSTAVGASAEPTT
jgi:predicted dehydrogenase